MTQELIVRPDILGVLSKDFETFRYLIKRCFPYSSDQELDAIIISEAWHLSYLADFDYKILECYLPSITQEFRKILMQNLSFDPDLGLVHIQTRKKTLAPKIKDSAGEQVTVLEVKPSVNGFISLYKMAGTLAGIEPSVIKFDSKGCVESIVITLNCIENVKTVKKSFTFTKIDWKKWQTASHKQNAGKAGGNIQTLDKANALYSSNNGEIDVAFAETKCLGHALKRARLDKNPYARKSKEIIHEVYVNPKTDIYEEFEDNYVEPEPVEDVPISKREPEPTKVKEPEPTKAKKEDVVKPEDKEPANTKNKEDLLDERLLGCKSTQDINNLLKELKITSKDNPDIYKKCLDYTKNFNKKPEPKVEQPEPIKDVTNEVLNNKDLSVDDM